jgi:hypothetical protein
MTTQSELTREETERLTRHVIGLRETLRVLELTDLTGSQRYIDLTAELGAITEVMNAALATRQDHELQRLRDQRNARERHAEHLRERDTDAEHRAEVLAWFRSRSVTGEPQLASEVLAAAACAGIDEDALLASMQRLRRRGGGEFLLELGALYPRRHYFAVESA